MDEREAGRREIAADYEAGLIKRAKGGDYESALDLIGLCASGLRSGTLSPLLARHLAETLEGVVDDLAGKDSAKGKQRPGDALVSRFLLLRTRGQPPKNASAVVHLAAAWIRIAIDRHNVPLREAFERAVEGFAHYHHHSESKLREELRLIDLQTVKLNEDQIYLHENLFAEYALKDPDHFPLPLGFPPR